MSDPNQTIEQKPLPLSVEEIQKAGLTKDDLSLLGSVKKFVNKGKGGGKGKSKSSSTSKKSELASRLGRVVTGIDQSKVKMNALDEAGQKEKTEENITNLRKSMAELSQKQNFDYKTAAKVFKDAGKVMADLPPPPKAEKKVKAAEGEGAAPESKPREAPTPSTA